MNNNKNKNRNAAKLQRDERRKELVASGAEGHDNEYLKTLLDPERFTGVRYPDAHPRMTATVHALLNHEIYTFPTLAESGYDVGPIEPPGTYLNVFTPTLTNPLLEYRLTSKVTDESAFVGTVTAQSENYGLFPLNDGEFAYNSESGQMVINHTGTFNVRFPYSYASMNVVVPPMRGIDVNGDEFYGHPYADHTSTGASPSISITVVTGAPALATGTDPYLTWQLVSDSGSSIITGSFDCVVGSMVIAKTISYNTLLTIMNAGGVGASVGLPGIGLRLIFTSGTKEGYTISSICMQALAPGSVVAPRFVPIALPDDEVYARTIRQYRPVSASVWLEYEGADLTNGGQAAAIMFRGGESFGVSGLWDYSLIAETPGGYQGGVKLGTYSFWIPATVEDTLMRGMSSNRWTMPFIVNAGLVASPDLSHVLRLRIPINFEAISTSQFYNYAHSKIKPEWILHAAEVCRSMPTSMENPDHLRKIKEMLQKGVKTAGKVGSWVRSNWGWIGPAAGAVAALV